ncbi:MAG TPA: KUP/HAK/KT family potassium transporter, partial [Burkholderiales bacterium]
TPAFTRYVVPITVVVLFALFAIQRHGTGRMGVLFGPVMTVWFITLALLGVINILHHPGVLAAVNPAHAVWFFMENRGLAFVILGAVVLAVTGSETLYADMGHFGRRPIRLAWFGFVLPALVLNYFGQGALVLEDPGAVTSPFYHMAPDWALYPLVGLATLATVIASQAVISGAFSVTRQAMQLGFVPRMAVQHTSEKEKGQIYVPFVNWGLFALVLALVLGFRSSGNLAAAYGIAVTGDMVITSILAAMVVSRVWGWGPLKAGTLFACFLVIELSFFGANVLKIPDGGWFPLVVGGVIFTLLSTWKRGRELLYSRLREQAIELEPFITSLGYGEPQRVPGTAVFLTPNPRAVPHALLHNLKHNKVLHERVVLVTVEVRDVPHVAEAERTRVEPLPLNFCRVTVTYGFMDEPNLPRDLEQCARQGLEFDIMMETSFFIGRETLIPRLKSEMSYWRERLFITMFRNSGSATDFFRLPPNRVVEVGAQVTL